jgi:hypothetical protein
MAAQIVRVGPTGGSGGQPFSDEPGGARSRSVAQVRVWSGNVVDSVQMVWKDEDGEHSADRHGGTGGRMEVFELQEGETITRVTGRYGASIDSIVFHTSEGRTSKAYGGQGGAAEFIYAAPDGYEIAGFWGRKAVALDALGVVIRPSK